MADSFSESLPEAAAVGPRDVQVLVGADGGAVGSLCPIKSPFQIWENFSPAIFSAVVPAIPQQLSSKYYLTCHLVTYKENLQASP